MSFGLLTFSTFSTVKSAVLAAVLAGVSMLSEQANMTDTQHSYVFRVAVVVVVSLF